MHCIKCHKTLDEIGENHPGGGIVCHSYGNYGSTVFDSVFGEEHLVFFICDGCLEASREHILVKQKGKPYQPFATYEAKEAPPYTGPVPEW
jgi:hypothetical protein